jgi:hypothetical protein
VFEELLLGITFPDNPIPNMGCLGATEPIFGRAIFLGKTSVEFGEELYSLFAV